MPYSSLTCIYRISEALGLNEPGSISRECGGCENDGGCNKDMYHPCIDPEKTLRALERFVKTESKSGLERFKEKFPDWKGNGKKPHYVDIGDKCYNVILDNGDSKIMRTSNHKPSVDDTLQEELDAGDSGIHELVSLSELRRYDEKKRREEIERRREEIERKKRKFRR